MKPVQMVVVEEGPNHIVYGLPDTPRRERLKAVRRWLRTILSSL